MARVLLVVFTAVIALAASVQNPGFSVILLPDTQYYALRDHETYRKQTEWIAEHRDEHNTKFVIHLGDVTDQNFEDDWLLAWKAQWNGPDVAHRVLDSAKIPYSVTTGNHDYPWVGNEMGRRVRDASRFHSVFPPSRFEGKPNYEGKVWYGGHAGTTNENSFAFFDHNGLEFLVVSLEYIPRKDAMCWADSILRRNAAKRAILVTHCYQTAGGGHKTDCDQKRYRMTGASPEALWRELVRQNPNVFMVLSGHVNDAEHRRRNRLTNTVLTPRTPSGATTVHELLTDYQEEYGLNATHKPFHIRAANHGNGWLRRLNFTPNKVYVSVHSVLGAQTFNWGVSEGRYPANPNAPPHQFSFAYDMEAPVPTTGAPPSDRFTDRSVNSDETGNQLDPRVAGSADGNWVAVWEDDSEGTSGLYQIYARGFSPTGCQKFKDVVVNTVAAGQQRNPSIAANAQGRFIVVWEDSANAGNTYDIMMRGFDATAKGWVSQRPVHASTGRQQRPNVAINNRGDFVVVWEDDADGNGQYQIRVRGFDTDGNERFSQRTVNAVATGQQLRPAVAMREDGSFVVVWEDDGGDGVYQIKARGFTATGDTVGPKAFSQRTVNSVARGQQRRPAIALDAAGNFVVAFQDSGEDDVYQIRVRGFRSDGSESFPQRTVNSSAVGQQREPSIAAHGDGRFVITWEDSGDDDVYQIKARAFTAAGAPAWNQITVNSLSPGQQRVPSVALAPSGQFIVAWQDDLDGNGSWEILARGCSLSFKCSY